MKTSILFVLALLLTLTTFAQSPQKMSYQTVIRDASDALVTNQQVGIRVSVHQGSDAGAIVYQENHSPIANANGLVSLQLGAGIVSIGSMAGIDWASGPYFVETETDPAGGTDYSISGTSELLSVPYALYAANGGTPGPVGPQGEQGIQGNEGPQGAMGEQGPAGATGPQGATGAQGEQGPAGDANITGTPGRIIKFTSPTSGGDSEIFDDGTRIGIGTTLPTAKLSVQDETLGDVISTRNMDPQGNTSIALYRNDGVYSSMSIGHGNLESEFMPGASYVKSDGSTRLALMTNNGERMTILPTGEIGIDNSSPSSLLDVSGKTTTENIKITDGAADGKILTSNASGDASWKGLEKSIEVLPTMLNSNYFFNGPSFGAGQGGQPCITFPDGVTGDVQFTVPLPDGFSAENIAIKVYYTGTSAGGTFDCSLFSRGIQVGAAMDLGVGGGALQVPGPASANILTEGIAGGGNFNSDADVIMFQLRRRGDTAVDTNSGELKVFGISIEYTE